MATKVTIRKKPISGGRDTLYLDFYPPIKHPDTGKPTRREFLGLYVHSTELREEQTYTDSKGKEAKRIVPVLDKNYKPKKVVLTALQKRENENAMTLAESMRSQRQLDIQSEQFGFMSTAKRNSNFVEYFRMMVNKRKGSNHDNWHCALQHFEDYCGGEVKVSEMDGAFCDGFREYLLNLKTLKQNTKLSYFGKFRAAIKQAYAEGLFTEDIGRNLKPIPTEETRREYLTLDELKTLAQTDCDSEDLKRAALFSAFTGLRHSDIMSLTWGIIQRDNAGWVIRFTQQKTKGVEDLPISDEAMELLGDRGNPDDIIFGSIARNTNDWHNRRIKQWVAAAGITKKITFHTASHRDLSFAL